MRVALVGNGKMGSAMLTQWLAAREQRLAWHRFTVIDPGIDPDATQGDDRVTYHRAPPPVDECAFDLVIAAVKPQVMADVLPDYATRLSSDGLIASIAAGCSIERLRALSGGAAVVRIMPNLPAAIGKGVSGLCAHPSTSAEQRYAVEELMHVTGSTLWVEDEDQLDRLTAIAGSGPGYVFQLAASYVDAAQAMGFAPADARKLVLGTLAGTVAMARQSDKSLDELRDSVTSKGGTTAAGLSAFNGDGEFDALIRRTLDAAYARAIELR